MSDSKKKNAAVSDSVDGFVIFIFVLIGVLSYYFGWEIGLIVGVPILLLYYYTSYQLDKSRERKQIETKQQKKIMFTEKYGDEMGKLISDRELRIGMTKEIVSEILGLSSFQQEKVNKKGIISTCYYEPFGEKGKENIKNMQYLKMVF